jgi:hypothetical protein
LSGITALLELWFWFDVLSVRGGRGDFCGGGGGGGIVEFDNEFEDNEARLTVDLPRIASDASFVCLLHQLPMS